MDDKASDRLHSYTTHRNVGRGLAPAVPSWPIIHSGTKAPPYTASAKQCNKTGFKRCCLPEALTECTGIEAIYGGADKPMRYFKYSGPWPDIEPQKKLHADLSSLAKSQHRRTKWLHNFGTAIFFFVFLGLFAGAVLLIHAVMPLEEGIFGFVLNVLGTLALSFIALILCAIVGAIAAAPLWGRQQKIEKALIQETLNNACKQLRDFYQFHEPFLVTKCYESSDRKFNRHDVCIFIAEDELRITANLHYGFFHPDKDLGCYGLTRQDIRIRDAQFKGRPATELCTEGVSFLLGCRASAFIEKYFTDTLSS